MEKLSLAGDWTLSECRGNIRVPMAVPGDILSALIQAGLAPDPYAGMNEDLVQWVGRADWLIEREFELSPALASCRRIFLDIAVLDTIAKVEVNGTLLGENLTMFNRFRRDLRPHLRQGKNSIAVTVLSAEKAAERMAAALPYPIPESTYPRSSPHRNLVRKAQCMGGWDWGPCLMTGGIYDSIEIIGSDGPAIEYLRAEAVAQGGFESLAGGSIPTTGPDFLVMVQVEASSLAEMDALLSVSLAGEKQQRQIRLPEGLSTHGLEFLVRRPSLWWPAGMGDHILYELTASLGAVEEEGRKTASAHSVQKRIGFRELSVSTNEDEIGREMKFVVNGHDVFAKGANWIPADALPSRWTREWLADLLGSAVDANMNCLRVWGGGRYESDDFYELCDEFGILIWQDCMFSCALYPSSPDFLALVEEEMRHQVKRLADHPCLALWCGNNEALGAITWYEESKKNPARYIVDYDRLTEGVLGRVVRELDPRRCWWPSSPSAGPNDFSDNWHSDERGDMHFWSVWHEGKPFSEYVTVRPRFCSEFGFQSFPSLATVESFAAIDERNISSPTMEAHQRHPRGNSLIIDTMLRYFRMPKNFKATLYLSQVQQAMAIQTAVEFWRSERPRCMGSLYWQLNDVWPVTSWSSLEYSGAWKLLHYAARRFYDPLLLSLILIDGRIELRAVNDGFADVDGKFQLSFVDFSGKVLRRFDNNARLPAEKSTILWSMRLADAPTAPDRCFAEARFLAADTELGSSGRKGSLERRTSLFLTEPKRCSLVDARLSLRVEAAEVKGESALFVRIVAKAAPAFYVSPEFEGIAGRFEDSGFHLAQGESRRLRFFPKDPGQVRETDDLLKRLTILDLRSSYD
ncbi:MAG: glycoside hydrolase family 2 protein [Rectinemataceae bacterium]|nr:glycoside hydrolase family 2 protein [Rectinemataceae bacterium]